MAVVKGRPPGEPDPRSLRVRAEERCRDSCAAKTRSPHDSAALMQELHVHQVELEIQNEELVQSRAEVEAALARYAELYDEAPVGYLTLDARGFIQHVNVAGAALLGFDRDAGVKVTFASFVEPTQRPTLTRMLEEAAKNAKTCTCEVTLRPRADVGRPATPIHLSASRPHAGGECRLVVTDLTVLRKTEEQLKNAEKLEAIGRLAGGVAHDFNNLLTVIRSHAELALEAVATGQLRDDLLEVKVAVDSAVGLTKQLLAFSRRDDGRTQVVDVSDTIRGLAGLLRRQMGTEIDLVLSLVGPSALVAIDPVELERILINLTMNARDALPNGGTVTLSTRSALADSELAPRFSPGAKLVAVVVTDTGVGMVPATKARLFEPFFTTKDKDRGVGFGLSTVYGIVRQCGGDISVESTEGKGTSFTLLLPAATPGDARRGAALEGDASAVPVLPRAGPSHSHPKSPSTPEPTSLVRSQAKSPAKSPATTPNAARRKKRKARPH